MLYVLVTGSREFTDEIILFKSLDLLLSNNKNMFLVVGDCETGADQFARDWAYSELSTPSHIDSSLWGKEFKANWGRKCDEKCFHPRRYKYIDNISVPYCPVAGHLRNQEMVDFILERMKNQEAQAICLAFFKLGAKNRGTRDCAMRARKAKIRVEKYVQGKV